MNESIIEGSTEEVEKKNNISLPKKMKPPKKPQKPKFEDLSESDIKRLMGMDMPRFLRHKGALRQR